MMVITMASAVLLCALACSTFYLSCPNQQWFRQQLLSFYPGLTISILLSGAAWWQLTATLSLFSASFTVLFLLMLFFSILPFLSPLDQPQKHKNHGKKLSKKPMNDQPFKPHWWIKLCVGLLLGFPLAIGLVGLLAYWGPDLPIPDDKTQLVMWLVTPIWLTLLSLVFLAQRIFYLLGVFSGLNGIVYLLLWTAKNGI